MSGLPFRSTPIFPTEPGAGGGGGGSVNSVTAGNSGITIGGTAADPTVALAAHGTTYHTGNVFPTTSDQTLGDYSIVFGDRTAPSTPSAGTCAFYLNAATGFLTVKYDTGTTVALDGAGGGGTVTSVALTAPSIFSVSGSPVTTSGTLAITLATQAANTVFAGPTTGAAAAPTFRALVADDIPSLDAAKITSGTFAVARGGTGVATITGVIKGNGTSAFSAAVSGTDYVAPGAVTSSGLTMATSRLLGRTTASTGAIEELTASSALDLVGSTRGAVLYRGASGWAILAPGTNGYVLTSNGAGADPSYQAGGGGGGANTALSNLASLAINTSLLPGTDNSIDLGSTSKHWKDLILAGDIKHTNMADFAMIACSSTATSIGHNTFSNYGGRLYCWTVGGVGGVTVSDATGSAWPISVRATALVACDASSSTGAGDSGFKKSAASGGNMTWQYDGTETIRDDGTDIQFLASRHPGLRDTIGSGSQAPFVAVRFTATATATVSNTTTETTIIGSGTGSLTIPASRMRAGSTYRVRVIGYYSSAASPGTLRLRLKFGSTTILDTTAKTAHGSAAGDLFDLEGTVTCRTTGGTGTVMGQGRVLFPQTNNFNDGCWTMVNTATTTIATTSAQTVDVTAQWGTADAGNSISGAVVTFEELN